MLTFLVGGARSGKSSLALEIARRFGGNVTFIATAEPGDAEFAERIDRHRDERPVDWETVEEPVELAVALGHTRDDACVIVDCLTLWVANLFGRGVDDDAIIGAARGIGAAARDRPFPVVIVSNEVGSGIVPVDALSRRYRDTLGRVNAVVAEQADAAFLVVAGRILPLSAPDLAMNPVRESLR